jgi:chromosome segregation ATPase
MSSKLTETLKALAVRLQKHRVERKDLQEQISHLRSLLNISDQAIETLQKQYDELRLSTKTVSISDHALVRYFERVKGENIEEVKSYLIPDKIQQQITTLGNGKYPHPDGFFIVVEAGKVKTIYLKEKETA